MNGNTLARAGRSCLLAVAALAAVAGAGLCAGGGASFLEGIKAHEEKLEKGGPVAVSPVTRPVVTAGEPYQGGTFAVLARKGAIGRYPCSSCHGKGQVPINNGLQLTHGDVVVKHGREGNSLSCIDCHHPEDRDALEDKKGNRIDFDHSYQLCGQCHFRQKRDWLGGAHGKRVEYWAGERVVYNCTTCHNPHSPRFAPRFPATYAVPLP